MASAIAKDWVGHILEEGDRVVFQQSEPINRGKVVSISKIITQGPYNGGTRVKIVHNVEFLIPPGHTSVPVTKAVKTSDEIKEDERERQGLPVESALSL